VIAATTIRCSAAAVADWVRADDWAIGRTIGFTVATVTAVTALMTGSTISRFAHVVAGDTMLRIVVYMMPSALVIAIPLSLLVGIISGIRGLTTTRVTRSLIVVAAICSIRRSYSRHRRCPRRTSRFANWSPADICCEVSTS